MNRLIIIGNGFDLAHQMKTSYRDFILNYIKKGCLEAKQKGVYDDKLFRILKNVNVSIPNIDDNTILNDIITFKNLKSSFVSAVIGYHLDENNYSQNVKPFTLNFKSAFIQHLFTKCDQNKWVNIENEYYNTLKKLLGKSDNSKDKELSDLNDTMKVLIDEIGNYMHLQKSSYYIKEYLEILKEEILKNDVVTFPLTKNELPNNSLILNFNYTKTIEEYIGSLDFINYIHGNTDDKDNPIVFGFGDELDNDYEKIESEKSKGFLNYIKSFWYFRTSNYHNLIRFIESDVYQVYILGHSCGLSDRTMLNMIFENNNCKSIKIFYYQTENGNNFEELTQEVSRHFHNKGEMRKKIIPFSKMSYMPQK